MAATAGSKGVPVRLADGGISILPFTMATAAAQKSFPVQLADGKLALARCVPASAVGQKAIPVRLADGRLVLVHMVSGMAGTFFRLSSGVYWYGGRQCGGVLRWRPATDEVFNYARNTTIDTQADTVAARDIIPQGFNTQIGGYTPYPGIGVLGAAILGTDVYVSAMPKYNKAWLGSGSVNQDASIGGYSKYNRSTDSWDDIGLERYTNRCKYPAGGQFMLAVDGDLYVYFDISYACPLIDTYTAHYPGWCRIDIGSPSTMTVVGESSAGGASQGIYVLGACEWNDKLVMWGRFASFGGDFTTDYLMTYTPSTDTWAGLGTFNDSVLEANSYDGNLYVCGAFTTIDGNPFNRVAKYDGASWTAVGGGIKDDRSGGNAGHCIGRRSGDKFVVLGRFNHCGTAALGNELTFTINSQVQEGNIAIYDFYMDEWTLVSNTVPQKGSSDLSRITGVLSYPFTATSTWSTDPIRRTWLVGSRVIFNSSQDLGGGRTAFGFCYVNPEDGTWQNPFPGANRIGDEYQNYEADFGPSRGFTEILQLPKLEEADPEDWFLFDRWINVVTPYVYFIGADFNTGEGFGSGYEINPLWSIDRVSTAMNAAYQGATDLSLKKTVYHISDSTSLRRWQGGVGTKAVSLRLWDIAIDGTFSIPSELTDYLKSDEPIPIMPDYQTSFLLGYSSWPMFDAEENRVLLDGINTSWNPLSVKPTVNMYNPAMNPDDYTFSEWSKAGGAAAWTGGASAHNRGICQDPVSGTWYRLCTTPDPYTNGPLQYWNGSAWAYVSGWGSVAGGDQTKYFYSGTGMPDALMYPWFEDTGGTFYCVWKDCFWKWSSASGYSIIKYWAGDASCPQTTLGLPWHYGNYFYMLATFPDKPPTYLTNKEGWYVARFNKASGVGTQIVWVNHPGYALDITNPYNWYPLENNKAFISFQHLEVPRIGHTWARRPSDGVVLLAQVMGGFVLDFTTELPEQLIGAEDRGPGRGFHGTHLKTHRPTHNRIGFDTLIAL